jgi:hypothetical protein
MNLGTIEQQVEVTIPDKFKPKNRRERRKLRAVIRQEARRVVRKGR